VCAGPAAKDAEQLACDLWAVMEAPLLLVYKDVARLFKQQGQQGQQGQQQGHLGYLSNMLSLLDIFAQLPQYVPAVAAGLVRGGLLDVAAAAIYAAGA
jgi:hypothetical protein